jgi:hypothetical protein
MKVEYFPETHTYTLDGSKVNSVTQILDASGLSDFSHVDPDVLKRAGEFGDAVHDMTVLDDLDDLDVYSLDLDLFPYLDAWRKFKKESGFQLLAMEHIVYSKKYLFAGRYDRRCVLRNINDKLTLLDLKSGVHNKITVSGAGIQTAGYSIAHDEGMKLKDQIKQRVGVWLKETGEYKMEIFTNKSDYTIFRAALTMANFKGGQI